jgi:Flp pilus assembly protein TadG
MITVPSHHKQTAGQGADPMAARAIAQEGAALVELALVLPMLLLLLFGIVQFGLGLNVTNDATHVANEVARYATVNEDPGGKVESLQEWARKQLNSNALTQREAEVCISFPNGATIGNPVEVKVRGQISWFPLLKLKVASTPVEGKADMRLEAVPSTYEAGCYKK